PDLMGGLLQPAEAVVVRDLGDPAAPALGPLRPVAAPASALLLRADLLPQRRRDVVAGQRGHRPVPVVWGGLHPVAQPDLAGFVVVVAGQLVLAVVLAAPVQPRRARTRRGRHA